MAALKCRYSFLRIHPKKTSLIKKIATYYFLKQVRKKKYVETSDWENQVIGTMYVDEEKKSYVVVATANDSYGKDKLKNIRNTLIISFLIGIFLTIFLGIIFAGQSLVQFVFEFKNSECLAQVGISLSYLEGARIKRVDYLNRRQSYFC